MARLKVWAAVGAALVLAAAFPLTLFLDLMDLAPWVLVVSTRDPHLMGHTRTRWALGVFGLHVPFLWLALPFVPGIAPLAVALTILVSLATTALPMLLMLGDRRLVVPAPRGHRSSTMNHAHQVGDESRCREGMVPTHPRRLVGRTAGVMAVECNSGSSLYPSARTRAPCPSGGWPSVRGSAQAARDVTPFALVANLQKVCAR